MMSIRRTLAFILVLVWTSVAFAQGEEAPLIEQRVSRSRDLSNGIIITREQDLTLEQGVIFPWVKFLVNNFLSKLATEINKRAIGTLNTFGKKSLLMIYKQIIRNKYELFIFLFRQLLEHIEEKAI